MLHRFDSTPPVGTAIVIDELQRFELVRIDPHVRADGQSSAILVWMTECATCGVPFTRTSGLTVGSLNRRCDKHKRPGQRVNKRKRKVDGLDARVVFP